MDRDPELASLARQAASGDRAALRAIYERTSRALFSQVLVPILGSRAACEDALKETFLAVIERPQRLADGEVFAYLATIAKNKALDRRRRMATEGRFQAALAAELERVEAPGPEEAAQTAESRRLARERIQACLSRMNPRYARAVSLRLLDERSREACAAELGTTVGAFDVLFFRACKQFRALYVDSYGRAGGGTT